MMASVLRVNRLLRKTRKRLAYDEASGLRLRRSAGSVSRKRRQQKVRMMPSAMSRQKMPCQLMKLDNMPPNIGASTGTIPLIAPRMARKLASCRPSYISVAMLFDSTTRGATWPTLQPTGVSRFQSTRPRGARPSESSGISHTLRFQSTRPRGARHNLGRSPFLRIGVSIHAPTRGATLSMVRIRIIPMFQSTRPRGARPSPCF